jgi:hypothetical protein
MIGNSGHEDRESRVIAMGNLVALLSTIIMVSTLGTVVFAVLAYILSRRQRKKPAPANNITAPPPVVVAEQIVVRSEGSAQPVELAGSNAPTAAPASGSIATPVIVDRHSRTEPVSSGRAFRAFRLEPGVLQTAGKGSRDDETNEWL